jgi:hypothetical protein
MRWQLLVLLIYEPVYDYNVLAFINLMLSKLRMVLTKYHITYISDRLVILS